MSYDLAVWEGKRPSTNAEAAKAFRQLYDENIGGKGNREPTPAITAYVDALLKRWPDITEDEGDNSPWSDGPLINNARGPIVYFGMVFSMAEEASAFAAETAATHGLVCFDPQTEELRP
jgi:hypothetical protein